MSHKSVIEVEALIKKYGSLVAVDSIYFNVRSGEVFAFLGPNGAGKTTTVEILECLRPLTGGHARVLGYDVTKRDEAKMILSRIGVLPQDFNALDRLSVTENIELFGRMYSKHLPITELVSMLGLKEKAKEKFQNLSGGLKQRVGLAAALVNDPELVFLDEPTSGLDPRARRDVWGVLRNLRGMGKTIFLTTHYMEEAQTLADRIAIINKGRIVALGSSRELVEKHGGSNVEDVFLQVTGTTITEEGELA